MPVLIAALALTLIAVPARSMTLDEVRRSLADFRGTSALKVKIDSHRRSAKEKTDRRQSATAEYDGSSMRVEGIESKDALELMNYAPALLKALDGATLKSATQTSLDGAPATLLEIVPVREKSDNARYVKQFSDVLLLWLGAGGVPVAAERTQFLKAKFLLVGFEARAKEKVRFIRSHDRLVVAKQTIEVSTAGLGKDENGLRSATVSIVQ